MMEGMARNDGADRRVVVVVGRWESGCAQARLKLTLSRAATQPDLSLR